ncbi:hypothetical protein [Streptomyces axinellae]|uniref:Uncharacterized protein n=1 Tax=Streptomyces axinellae TaxID=552788 RepID=A0ABP6CP05_9ACTN
MPPLWLEYDPRVFPAGARPAPVSAVLAFGYRAFAVDGNASGRYRWGS